MEYIHQLSIWPKFRWDHENIASLLGEVRNRQGRLIGRMEGLGFSLRSEAMLKILTLDVVESSEIEGETLDMQMVRSSIARKLGIEAAGLVPSDRNVDGVVEMMLDATQNFNKALTKDRLFGWHASLFPSLRIGMHKIIVGAWRNDKNGPMRVVSGPIGREKVHFEAPEAKRINLEMKKFLSWFNTKSDMDPVLKATVAHLWFVTIHPFDDGNGRIARAITDMQLSRADGSKQRYYSMSVQIRKERKTYYEVLEETQKSVYSVDQKGINITAWLVWFLGCLNRALDSTESTLESVFKKARFFELHPAGSLNERQRLMIIKLFESFEGNITSTKWAKITKCSQDTALRDILDLVEKGIFIKNPAGGRSTSYSMPDGI